MERLFLQFFKLILIIEVYMVEEKLLKLSLSDNEVNERVEQGLVNTNSDAKSKSIKRIFFDNLFTFFNLLNVIFAVMLIMVGAFRDMLFLIVIVTNVVIGIVQEIRSKRAVDRLSIVVSSSVEALRNGRLVEIDAEQIVRDDVIVLKSGAQIPCDCEIIEGFCYANESLLTGESDLIEKNPGDRLLSGSFVTSGEVYVKVKNVGKDSYAAKIQQEAKVNKKVNSEIMITLNRIITYCSIALFPVGVALFVNQRFFNDVSFNDAVPAVVAALIGMIPEGLVLLTSTVLAVSVIRLSTKNVLVQQLFCIETLARVDVLCLDKTGTITTGDLEVEKIIVLNDDVSAEVALKSLCACAFDKNSTLNAIDRYVNGDLIKAKEVIPFTSEKKWSGAALADGRSYVLGAAELMFDNSYKELFGEISKIDDTFRVVTLAYSDEEFTSKEVLPEKLVPLALVVIRDKIRENASDTIQYFIGQGVQLKVISGDNSKTVGKIASFVGVPNAEVAVDATTLDTDEKLIEAAEKYSVFGRVTPQQKKKLVKILKNNGHTVAMTGDGVNDVLALKESDCSIAVASGSDAAKNISQLILTDDDFRHMPEVVAEGRRSINNIQRSASLFIVKTIYAAVLALAFIFISYNYPFKPIQMSFLDAFLIGIPSFVLALQPNHNRVKGNFMKNVFMRAWPGSVMVLFNIFTLLFFRGNMSHDQFSTMAAILTALVGVMTVIRLSLPMNALRFALVIFIVTCLTVGIIFFGWFFRFAPLGCFELYLLLILSGITVILYNVIYNVSKRLNKDY